MRLVTKGNEKETNLAIVASKIDVMESMVSRSVDVLLDLGASRDKHVRVVDL